MKLSEGDWVTKTKGYSYSGMVVSVFTTLAGERRVVVENEQSRGMLHIFNEGQLRLQ